MIFLALADKKRQDAIQEIVNKQGISELVEFVKNVNRSELVAQPILAQCDFSQKSFGLDFRNPEISGR